MTGSAPSTGPEPTTGGGTMVTGEPMTTSGGTSTGGDDTSTGDATTADPTGSGLSCAAYCGTIATNCIAEWTQWGMDAFCMSACELFPVGTVDDLMGNTLGCRTYHAGAAAMDPSVHCVHAGPGGSGACGANCDGFCSLARGACPEEWPDAATCPTACMGFADTEPYDASDVGGDTFACRLYHATAATKDPVTHCAHIKADSPPCK